MRALQDQRYYRGKVRKICYVRSPISTTGVSVTVVQCVKRVKQAVLGSLEPRTTAIA